MNKTNREISNKTVYDYMNGSKMNISNLIQYVKVFGV